MRTGLGLACMYAHVCTCECVCVVMCVCVWACVCMCGHVCKSEHRGLPNSSYFDGSYRDPDGCEAYSMLPVVRSPYHEATDVTTGTGTRAIDENTPIGELSQTRLV